MTETGFRIVPLETAAAEGAGRAVRSGAPDHRLVVVDEPGSAPCRHCLQWAQPGEKVVLFSYASIPAGKPYSETGPIFVHFHACERYAADKEYPAEFRSGRSIRAYDAEQNMVDAEVCNGVTPEAVIAKFFENPETVFLQVRSASRGCYTMKVERR